MRLTGPLAAVDADERSFLARPTELERVDTRDLSRAPLRPEIALILNQPTPVAALVASCRVSGPAGNVPVESTLADDTDASATRVTVRPTRELDRDRDYTLVCGDLTPVPFHTRPRFRLVDRAPTSHDVAPNDTTITLRFSTPVALDAIRAHLASTPEIPGLRRGWLDADRTTYAVKAELATGTDYAITIDKKLRDVFGQPLDDDPPPALTFRTGDSSPTVSMSAGIFTVEPEAGGYPIWTRNVDALDVTCARIPADRVAALLTSAMQYDPWSGMNDREELDWKALGARPRATRLAPRGKRNAWHLERLVPTRACDATPGRPSGLFLAEVSTDEVTEGRWSRRRGDGPSSAAACSPTSRTSASS